MIFIVMGNDDGLQAAMASTAQVVGWTESVASVVAAVEQHRTAVVGEHVGAKTVIYIENPYLQRFPRLLSAVRLRLGTFSWLVFLI